MTNSSNKGWKTTKRFLPAICWAILIFIASSIPSHSLPSMTVEVSDLLIHFAVYTVFGVLLSMALIESPYRINWKMIAMIIVLGMLYGASDEFHQRFVQGRVATVSDFLADSAGVLFGIMLFVIAPRCLRLLGVSKYSS